MFTVHLPVTCTCVYIQIVLISWPLDSCTLADSPLWTGLERPSAAISCTDWTGAWHRPPTESAPSGAPRGSPSSGGHGTAAALVCKRGKVYNTVFRYWILTILWILIHVPWFNSRCYLLAFTNMLLTIPKNCMILSSKCKSSSPLNKYGYLEQENKNIKTQISQFSHADLVHAHKNWLLPFPIGPQQNQLLGFRLCGQYLYCVGDWLNSHNLWTKTKYMKELHDNATPFPIYRYMHLSIVQNVYSAI